MAKNDHNSQSFNVLAQSFEHLLLDCCTFEVEIKIFGKHYPDPQDNKIEEVDRPKSSQLRYT